MHHRRGQGVFKTVRSNVCIVSAMGFFRRQLQNYLVMTVSAFCTVGAEDSGISVKIKGAKREDTGTSRKATIRSSSSLDG